ncbi:hypothetical protein D3C87_1604250 [compost metagenome]
MAAGGDCADQREGNVAGLIDRIGTAEARLLENVDAQPVAAVQPVGLDRCLAERLGCWLIACAAAEQHRQCCHRNSETRLHTCG